MEAPVPSPQTTLLILLGASKWPLFPEFQDSEAFANAAREFKVYFLDPKRFGLSPENVLDVFNSNRSPVEQEKPRHDPGNNYMQYSLQKTSR